MPQFEKLAFKITAEPAATALRENLEHRVDVLRQANVVPRLVIVTDNNRGRIAKYVKAKFDMAERLGIETDVATPYTRQGLKSHLKQASADPEVNGIILQFPVAAHATGPSHERNRRDQELVQLINFQKDVDGLTVDSPFKPATALGIRRLLRQHVPDYRTRNITLHGNGALVNRPLGNLLEADGAESVSVIDVTTSAKNRRRFLDAAEIIISATGQPGSLDLTSFDASKPKAIIDAGTAEHQGQVLGDASLPLRVYAEQTPGWGITPRIGGVGPMTVLELLGNVVAATEDSAMSGLAYPAWASDNQLAARYTHELAYADFPDAP